MSLLNQNKKGKKKEDKKSKTSTSGSKFIQKPKASSGFVGSKQQNTGSQRGS